MGVVVAAFPDTCQTLVTPRGPALFCDKDADKGEGGDKIAEVNTSIMKYQF